MDELVADSQELFGIAAQEFTSGRDVVEKIAHHETSSRRRHHYFVLAFNLRSGNGYLAAQFIFWTARVQFHLGDGGNRSQSFSAETFGLQTEKIAGLFQFGGGVSFKAKSRILCRHTFSVVVDLNERLAGILDEDVYLCSVCVDGVFHQLFHHRRGLLHHFAGSNLIGYMFG